MERRLIDSRLSVAARRSGGISIAGFWFLYFGGLGVFFPYYSLYLRENAGLSGTQVGLVMAVVPLVGLVAQPFWGNLADRTGARSTVLGFLAMCAAVSYVGLSFASGFGGILAATAVLALFATAVVPVSVSIALGSFEQSGPHAFGIARVFGTIGYLIAVAAFPAALEWWTRGSSAVVTAGVSEPALPLMFYLIALLGCLAALVAPFMPRTGATAARAGRGDWRALLRMRPVVALLIVAFTSFLFLQGPMALFPILVRSRGGEVDTIGRLWVVMLILEVPLIALAGTGLQRIGARGLLTVGVVSGGMRWLACGTLTDPFLFYAVQILHGITVMGLMVGGPLYLEQVVPAQLRSTSQSMLAMLGVGAGGLTSNVVTGWLMDRSGVDLPYILGGVGALLLGLSLRWILPKV